MRALEKGLFAIVVLAGVAAMLAEVPAGAAGRRTAIPEGVRGNWMYGNISPTDFYEQGTGSYLGNAYGVGIWFTFDADGGFKMFQYNYSTTYNCRVETWTALEGTVSFEEARFKTYPASGKYRVANSCAKSQNYTRPMTEKERGEAQGKTYTWDFEKDAGAGKTYLMIAPEGAPSPSQFRRAD